MKKLLYIFILICLFFLLKQRAEAAELAENNISIRSQGMGGVYGPVVNYGEALLFNPAALGYVSGIYFELMNIGGGLNGLDAATQLSTISSSPNPGDLNNYMGSSYWVGLNGRAVFVLPNFGIGFYNNANINMDLHNPVMPEFEVGYLNDTGIVIGGAVELNKNSYLGLSLKQINRVGGIQSIGAATISNSAALQNLSSQFTNAGVGYAADFALMTKLDAPVNPTLTMTWENMGGTVFRPTAGVTSPPYLSDNISLGASVGQDLPGIDWIAAMEIRHIKNYDHDISKKIHMGAELSLPFIDLRVGGNQGYSTFGGGFDMLFMKFDVAYYDVEVGEYAGQTKQNRIMFGFSFDLSFDANFKLDLDSSKKRKIKQRR